MYFRRRVLYRFFLVLFAAAPSRPVNVLRFSPLTSIKKRVYYSIAMVASTVTVVERLYFLTDLLRESTLVTDSAVLPKDGDGDVFICMSDAVKVEIPDEESATGLSIIAQLSPSLSWIILHYMSKKGGRGGSWLSSAGNKECCQGKFVQPVHEHQPIVRRHLREQPYSEVIYRLCIQKTQTHPCRAPLSTGSAYRKHKYTFVEISKYYWNVSH